GTVNALITSVYFVPILSGIGAIQLAQEPDGILSLTGQQKVRRKRERARRARLAEVEAQAHGGMVPEHERTHSVVSPDGEHPTESFADSTFAMNDIVAGYGDAEVLHGVDLRLDRGSITALLGANGAGKSTLCAVAAGMV